MYLYVNERCSGALVLLVSVHTAQASKKHFHANTTVSRCISLCLVDRFAWKDAKVKAVVWTATRFPAGCHGFPGSTAEPHFMTNL